MLLNMRRQRLGLIQTPDQLRFSYIAILQGAIQDLHLETSSYEPELSESEEDSLDDSDSESHQSHCSTIAPSHIITHHRWWGRWGGANGEEVSVTESTVRHSRVAGPRCWWPTPTPPPTPTRHTPTFAHHTLHTITLWRGWQWWCLWEASPAPTNYPATRWVDSLLNYRNECKCVCVQVHPLHHQWRKSSWLREGN